MEGRHQTLLITDLVNSTRLVQTLGDLRSGEVFALVEHIIRSHLAEAGGLEIDKTDGFLLLFDEPLIAIRFALKMHRDLAKLSEELDLPLAVRCGIHVGYVLLRHNAPEAIERGAKPIEVEGIAKPTTARIMSLAHGGQTLISRTVYDLCRSQFLDSETLSDNQLTLHGPFPLKGIQEPVEIAEVTEEGVSPRRPKPPQAIERRTVSYRHLVLLLLLTLASFAGVFRIPDLYAQQYALTWLHGPMAIENTAVIGISDQSDYRRLRDSHPEVLHKLLNAGVTAVVFDIAMTAETAMDPALAQAIDDAAEAGMVTILPVHLRQTPEGDYLPEPPESELLRQSAQLGNVEFVIEERVMGTVVAGRVRRRTAVGDVWATSALALKAHLNARQDIRIEGSELVLGGTRNAVWADKVFLPPFAEPVVQDYFSETFDADLNGKVAVIGAHGGSIDMLRTPFGRRYGVEFHAAFIETLIRQRALRNAGPEFDAMGTFFVGLLSAIASWALMFRWRVLVLGVPAAALCIMAALTWSGILVSVSAPLLAAFLGHRISQPDLN